jgi:predicted O-methyltransferase YrrM
MHATTTPSTLPIDAVTPAQLHARLGLSLPFATTNPARSLSERTMQQDDGPILAYLYARHRPRRHLEFGTWQGEGTLLVLRHCEATVWTINLPDGERTGDGGWAYLSDFDPTEPVPGGGNQRLTRGGRRLCQTDSGGFIGRAYREADLGHRVCQIYADSTRWDTAAYPPGFFDSVLIDGGHTAPIVTSDTHKALPLLRPGGLLLWHDFCPHDSGYAPGASTRGVRDAIADLLPILRSQMRDLFWIQDTWILAGVRA